MATPSITERGQHVSSGERLQDNGMTHRRTGYVGDASGGERQNIVPASKPGCMISTEDFGGKRPKPR